MKLQQGKNYAWLFILLVLWSMSPLRIPGLGSPGTMAVLMLALAMLQWRSGFALNNWWTATVPKGSIGFKVSMVLHGVVIAALLWLQFGMQ